MGVQFNPSQFDPSKLGRIVSSEPIYDDTPYAGGDTGGNYNSRETSQRQIIGYKVVKESPWGPILINAQDAQGTPKPPANGDFQYSTARPNSDGSVGDFNNQVAFIDKGDGSYVEADGAQMLTEMSRGGAYKPFFKFLAVAGLGVGAAYASGVTGANATFAAGAGEGGAAGFGAGGNAATGTAGAVNSLPPGNNGYGEFGGATEPVAAGGEGVGSGVANGGPIGANGALTPEVAAEMAKYPASAQGGFLERLGIPTDIAKLLVAGGGAAFNAWNDNKQQDKLNAAAAGYADKVTAASQKAADMSKFTPFNVSGGLAGAKFDGNNVTQTLDPRMKAIQDQSLSQAGGFLGSVNAGTPDQLAKNAYTNYNAWAKPAQEQQFSGLQDRLAGQGLLGLSVNTQRVPAVQSGNTPIGIQGGTNADFQDGGRFGGNNDPISVNPYYKDFAQGVALADLKNYENSVKFGQETTNNQINMGKSFLGIGTGIDELGTNAINQGAKLGEASSRSGAVAGSFLANGARDAASVAMNRQGNEAGQTAERNRQIWDSIFKNLF